MHGLVQLQYTTTYMKQWRLQLVANPRFSKPFRCAYFCTTMWLKGLLCILIIIHECFELSQIQKLHLAGAFLYRCYYFWSLHVRAGNKSLISWHCAVSNNINVSLLSHWEAMLLFQQYFTPIWGRFVSELKSIFESHWYCEHCVWFKYTFCFVFCIYIYVYIYLLAHSLWKCVIWRHKFMSYSVFLNIFLSLCIIYKVFCTGAVKACCPLQVSLVLSALQAGNKGTQACITAASAVSGIIADLDTTIMFASAGTLNPENEDSFADHRCASKGNRLSGVLELNAHTEAMPLIFSGKLKDISTFIF